MPMRWSKSAMPRSLRSTGMRPSVVESSVVALLAVAACTVDVGGTTTFGGTETGGGSGGPGFTPDPVACEVAPECFAAIECCPLPQPSTSHVGAACPSAEWPNNWSCVNNICVHGGCTSSGQCSMPGFACAQVGGIGHCVAPCSVDADCTNWGEGHGMLHTECIGEDDSSNKFCLQPVPNP